MAKNKSRQSDVAGKAKRVNSFFAGIGGFDLAFEEQGFTPAFFCEDNEFCSSVLKRHWPTIVNAGDIQQLDPDDIPVADVWTAGFPCQDLSLARTPHGKRSGLKGSRSGLFYTFLELLSGHTPPIVLLENVAGLLNSHKGADFRTLVTSLTSLGYAVAWRVLNARYFGAPQSRPRVFVCAWRGEPSKAASVLFEGELAAKPKNERRGFMAESICALSGASVPQVSFCISATSGRHTGLDWARSYIAYPHAVRRLTPLECERLQGFPDNWTVPDKSYVVPIRGIESSRYHAIGNAVCVPVVRWVAGRISAALGSQGEDLPYRRPLKRRLQHLAETYLSPTCTVEALPADCQEWKWHTGGLIYRDLFATVSVSSSPVAAVNSRLVDVIEKKKVHERYFLSSNAAQGILRRVDKLGRDLFPPLDAALRRIAVAPVRDSDALEAESNVRSEELVAL